MTRRRDPSSIDGGSIDIFLAEQNPCKQPRPPAGDLSNPAGRPAAVAVVQPSLETATARCDTGQPARDRPLSEWNLVGRRHPPPPCQRDTSPCMPALRLTDEPGHCNEQNRGVNCTKTSYDVGLPLAGARRRRDRSLGKHMHMRGGQRSPYI